MIADNQKTAFAADPENEARCLELSLSGVGRSCALIVMESRALMKLSCISYVGGAHCVLRSCLIALSLQGKFISTGLWKFSRCLDRIAALPVSSCHLQHCHDGRVAPVPQQGYLILIILVHLCHFGSPVMLCITVVQTPQLLRRDYVVGGHLLRLFQRLLRVPGQVPRIS